MWNKAQTKQMFGTNVKTTYNSTEYGVYRYIGWQTMNDAENGKKKIQNLWNSVMEISDINLSEINIIIIIWIGVQCSTR